MPRSYSARSAAVLMGFGALSAASSAVAMGEKATAELKGLNGHTVGSLVIVETMSGLLLRIKASDLPPGTHGIHIHETGKCSGDFKSAGAIYNPLGAKHGFLNDEGPMAGDLPNVHVGADGVLDVELLSPFATISKDAEESIMDADGSALVILAGPDDYSSEPEGNAGQRIACGVIVPAK